jgi:hypothetical protein
MSASSKSRLLLGIVNVIKLNISYIVVVLHVDGVCLRLLTAATNEPTVRRPDDMRVWKPWWNDIERGKPKNWEKSLS